MADIGIVQVSMWGSMYRMYRPRTAGDTPLLTSSKTRKRVPEIMTNVKTPRARNVVTTSFRARYRFRVFINRSSPC